MKITIGSANIDMTESLREYAEEQLNAHMSRFDDQIQRVRVRVSVERRHSGRTISMCLLVVTLKNGSRLVIRERKTDLYHSITEASQRMRRALDKQHKKRLSTRNRWAVQPRPAFGI